MSDLEFSTWRFVVKFFTAALLGIMMIALAIPARAAAPDPQLTKALQDARAQLEKDTKAQKELKAKLKAAFDGNEESRNAKEAEDKAKADLEAAQKPVMEELSKKPEYKAAAEKQVQADLALAELQKGNPTADQLTAATEKMVNANAEVRRMKDEALQASTQVQEAKTKYQAAKEANKAVQAKFEEQLASDTDYQAATKLVDDDKQKVDEAKKALADAQKQQSSQRQASRSNSSTPRSSAPRGGGGGRGY